MTARMFPHDAVKRIQRRTADAFGVTVEDILRPDRRQKFVRPRQAAMFLARHFTPHSARTIGRIFQRDHSTITYSVDKAQILMEYEPEVRKRIIRLRTALSIEFRGIG